MSRSFYHRKDSWIVDNDTKTEREFYFGEQPWIIQQYKTHACPYEEYVRDIKIRVRRGKTYRVGQGAPRLYRRWFHKFERRNVRVFTNKLSLDTMDEFDVVPKFGAYSATWAYN